MSYVVSWLCNTDGAFQVKFLNTCSVAEMDPDRGWVELEEVRTWLKAGHSGTGSWESKAGGSRIQALLGNLASKTLKWEEEMRQPNMEYKICQKNMYNEGREQFTYMQ